MSDFDAIPPATPSPDLTAPTNLSELNLSEFMRTIPNIMELAIAQQNLPLAKWLHNHVPMHRDNKASLAAFANSDCEAIRWLATFDYPLSQTLWEEAAFKGNLKVTKCLCEINASRFTKAHYAVAQEKGHRKNNITTR